MGRRLTGTCVRFAAFMLGLVVATGLAATSAAAAPRWVHLMPNASPPSAAEDPIAFDTATQQLVLLDSVNGGTWTWDGSTWTPQTPSTVPSARSYAAMAYDAATKQLILFGGQNGPTALNATWNWTGGNWVQLSPANSPPPLDDASLAYDPATRRLLLFGGSSGFGPLADTWSWDGSTWTQLHPATSPPARSQAPMAYDTATSQLLLFGGASEETPLGDTWKWTGSNWLNLNTGASPSPRVAPALAYDAATQQFLLQNGVGGAGPLNDQWAWNGSTWSKQSQLSTVQPGRNGRTMAYDPGTSQLVLFGGGTNGGPDLGDTWVWTPLSVQTSSVPAGAMGVRYSTKLQAISGTGPYTWSVNGGALPAGLTLSPAGVISGTPTATGTVSFTVTAVDAAKPAPATATRTFTLQVFAAPRASVWVGNGADSNVNAFALSANGDAAPIATLSGALTGLNGIGALAFDSVGELWVASANNDALEQFAPGATGNVAPTRVVTGPNTGLVTPAGINLDSAGRLYVTESAANAVAIFPAGAAGNTPPLATISGPHTMLSAPVGITTSGGKIWVANQGNNTLTGYPSTASGDQAPSSTISGPTTELSTPAGLGLDSSGNLLVADLFGSSVLKFPLAGPFGDVAPGTVIGAPGAQLSLPEAVDTDTAGRVYVADENGGLNVYAAKGTTPVAVINGPATGLRAPGSVAVAPPLNLTTKTLPRAAFGRRYAEQVWAILGQTPLRWRLVRGHLPRGFKLVRSGRVTGIARQLGRFHLTVGVRDSGRPAQTAKARVTLIVARPPTVTRVEPSRGSHRGGAIVTITGTGFATARGATTVSFGPTHALRVRCRTSVRCTARTPPRRRGAASVTVTVGGLMSQRAPHARYRFTR